MPASLSGATTCHHVSGSTCIKGWLASENHNVNNCLTCRTLLYYVDDGYDDADQFDYKDQQNFGNNAIDLCQKLRRNLTHHKLLITHHMDYWMKETCEAVRCQPPMTQTERDHQAPRLDRFNHTFPLFS